MKLEQALKITGHVDNPVRAINHIVMHPCSFFKAHSNVGKDEILELRDDAVKHGVGICAKCGMASSKTDDKCKWCGDNEWLNHAPGPRSITPDPITVLDAIDAPLPLSSFHDDAQTLSGLSKKAKAKNKKHKFESIEIKFQVPVSKDGDEWKTIFTKLMETCKQSKESTMEQKIISALVSLTDLFKSLKN